MTNSTEKTLTETMEDLRADQIDIVRKRFYAATEAMEELALILTAVNDDEYRAAMAAYRQLTNMEIAKHI